MVETWAMILIDIVENIILWDGDTNTWQPPEGYLMEPVPEGSGVGPGWGWDGTNFVAPPPPPEPAPNPALDNPGSPPDVIQ
jgi:hypothetical protein